MRFLTAGMVFSGSAMNSLETLETLEDSKLPFFLIGFLCFYSSYFRLTVLRSSILPTSSMSQESLTLACSLSLFVTLCPCKELATFVVLLKRSFCSLPPRAPPTPPKNVLRTLTAELPEASVGYDPKLFPGIELMCFMVGRSEML